MISVPFARRYSRRPRSRNPLPWKNLRILLCVAVLGLGCAVPRWPVAGPLTSAYGLRWRGLLPELHSGADVYVAEGTPVAAMAGGRVTQAGAFGAYGLTVVLDHGGGTQSLYAHLSQIDVAVGDEVRGRQIIGLSGSTGNATGPHLHFEIRRRGRPEDPVPLLGRKPQD
jgi:murein DD-endopeptidase MepM/ murein hydrolase activator NlpD